MQALPKTTIGIDLGGTKCFGVLLDENNDIIAENRLPTPKGLAATVENIHEVIAGVIDGFNEPALPVGVGIPGLVDRSGTLAFGPNLDRLHGYPALKLLKERYGNERVIHVENDATCHAVAESRVGAARGSEQVLVVMLGTGIGGGFVFHGRPYVGSHGFAGEIGHMTVEPTGALCACGRFGCWETVASGRGLALLAREVATAGELRRVVALAGGDHEAVRGEHVTAAAAEGDEQALALLERFSANVALGLANLVQIFDPSLIVMGGGLIRSREVIAEPIQRHLTERLRAPYERPEVRVVPAALGERAGAIGAALLARDAS